MRVISTVATLAVTDAAPVIVTQPQSQTVNPGQSATFKVVANGSVPLSYQWHYNSDTPLSGATETTLTLTDVQPADAGSYSVVVSNVLGSVTSSNAILTVSLIPLVPSGLTAAGAAVFPYIRTDTGSSPIVIRYAQTFHATPLDATTTPLLIDGSGNALNVSGRRTIGAGARCRGASSA